MAGRQLTKDRFGSEVRRYAAGEVIALEGDESRRYYQIVSGEVVLVRDKIQALHLVAGDLFGLEAGLFGKRLSCSARALVSSTIEVHEGVELEDGPPAQFMASAAVRSLVSQQRQLLNRLQEHSSSPVPIDPLFEIRELVPGENLIVQGDHSRHAYRLISSQAGLRVSVSGMEVATISRRGALIGEMAMVFARPRTATVTSVGQSLVEVIPQERLSDLLESSPQLAARVLDLAVRRAQATDRALENTDPEWSSGESYETRESTIDRRWLDSSSQSDTVGS